MQSSHVKLLTELLYSTIKEQFGTIIFKSKCSYILNELPRGPFSTPRHLLYKGFTEQIHRKTTYLMKDTDFAT